MKWLMMYTKDKKATKHFDRSSFTERFDPKRSKKKLCMCVCECGRTMKISLYIVCKVHVVCRLEYDF